MPNQFECDVCHKAFDSIIPIHHPISGERIDICSACDVRMKLVVAKFLDGKHQPCIPYQHNGKVECVNNATG